MRAPALTTRRGVKGHAAGPAATTLPKATTTLYTSSMHPTVSTLGVDTGVGAGLLDVSAGGCGAEVGGGSYLGVVFTCVVVGVSGV